MTDYATVLPLRSLTPERKTAIETFYTPASEAGLFLSTYLPVVFGLTLGSIFFTTTQGLLAGVAIALLLVVLRHRKIRRNIREAKYVYQYGDTEPLEFEGSSLNYSYKINGAPQRILSVRQNGKPRQIKTFSPNVVAVYSLPQQSVFVHPEHPGVIVPEGLFSLQPPPKQSIASLVRRRVLLFGLPFAFVLGLSYFISGEMDSHSETHMQPDALIYRQEGKLVLATAVTAFKAYSVSNNVAYGNDYSYAEGIDLLTGKTLWKVKMDAGNSKGAVRLLGQSDRYLFFLRNELYVVDKKTGNVAARNKDFPGISAHLSEAGLTSYEDDGNYAWSDSLGAVVAKGTDGLFYTIDGATLRTGTVNITTPDSTFKNSFRFGNNYEDQITQVSDDGSHCYALLDTQDTTLLAHNPYGVESRPAGESVRRTLYRCASNTISDGWQRLNPGIFLFGGFLADATQPFRQPADTIAEYASYASLVARYNSGSHLPMRTAAGDFLLLSKTTIESSATLLLTAVSPAGATRWQVSTGYGSVPFMYKDVAANQLYLGGDNGGTVSDDINEVLRIDLSTGKIVREKIQ